MENDIIVNYICSKYNIDLNEYEIYNDDGFIFDKRFKLDRIYIIDLYPYKRRIRFVSHKEDEITYFRTTIKISNILKTTINEKKVYPIDKIHHIDINEIQRVFKLNKIKNKI